MEKTKLFFISVLVVIFGASSIQGREGGVPGIKGTPHDIHVITGEAGLESCAMCHSPHTHSGQYPLWNRGQGPQAYLMYASPSFDEYEFITGPRLHYS
jgi:hypothetical protein